MIRRAAILYSVQRLATGSTGRGLNPGRGKKFSLLQNRLEWFWEPTQWVPGFILEGKAAGT
jgi:hypothetical protein